MDITQSTISVTFDNVNNVSDYWVHVSPDDVSISTTSNEVTITDRNPGTYYTITVQSVGSPLLGSLNSTMSSSLNVTTGKIYINYV